MTITEQADALLDRAQPYVDAGAGNQALADQIKTFLATSSGALTADGGGDRIDQLEGAVAWLEGRGPGMPEAPKSPAGAAVTSFVQDETSLDNALGAEAKKTLSSWGAKAADAIGAGADSAARNALKHPSIVAGLIVVAVLGAAWAYRSFK